MAPLEYYFETFVGRRSNNEDSCLAVSLKGGATFLAVADGMGGVGGGEVASVLVLDCVKVYLESVFASDVLPARLPGILKEAFRLSQEVIRQGKSAQSGLEGMGTTLSCVLIKDDCFVVGNLGDSRVYLIREHAVRQLTEDHTHIQDFQRSTGRRADAEMLRAYGHVLTRSLDGGVETPDIFPAGESFWRLKEGDALLLCSDGLITDKTETAYNHWTEHIVGSPDLRTAAGQLISEAYEAGSNDNISVVLAVYGKIQRKLVQSPGRQDARNQQRNHPGRAGRRGKGIKVGLAALVLVLVVAASIFLPGRKSDTRMRPPDANSSKVIVSPPATETETRQDVGKARRIEWSPFPETAMQPYRMENPLNWSEYPMQDSVDHYEITFGRLHPARVDSNFIVLNQVHGLTPSAMCPVTVEVVLKDGRRFHGETKIKIQG